MRYHKSKAGKVYVVKHEHGYVKIGESGKPHDRLTNLQIGSPYQLSMFTVIDVVGDAEVVEETLHMVYSRECVRNEWFDLPEDELLTLAKIDRIYESVIEKVDGWTPDKHLNMDEDKREALRQSELEEQVDEALSLIESGDFPVENIAPDNPAVKNWAKAADAQVGLFIEKLAEQLDPAQARRAGLDGGYDD